MRRKREKRSKSKDGKRHKDGDSELRASREISEEELDDLLSKMEGHELKQLLKEFANKPKNAREILRAKLQQRNEIMNEADEERHFEEKKARQEKTATSRPLRMSGTYGQKLTPYTLYRV